MATKFGSDKGLANRNLFPEFFVNFGRGGGPVTTSGDMHQSFIDAHVKWFFDNFPMFADISRLVSIHCVARGLDAGFPYKCSASCGGSPRQHGLILVL